jgi:group I intron endonuclease
MKRFHIIYKITNTLNSKIYIGAHSTNDLNDSYYGSGKYIKSAIKKYGLINFNKEIIHIFNNSKDMYDAEASYVNEEFISDPNNYNIKLGGQGGWDHMIGRKHSEETKQKMSDMNKGKKLLETTKKKLSLINTGKTASDTTRQKMSTSHKGKIVSAETKDRLSGKNNGNYGTICITDGYNNSRILKEACIPDGWYAGRTVSVETKEKMSLGIRKEKHPAYGKMWINNCITNKLIHKETVIPDGWHKGMITNS